MTARGSYGQTWWGAQWLNALTLIDYDNCLPRGRSYANKGAVTAIEIQNGKIHAKVKGSRPRPYSVDVEVPKMPEQQTRALLDTLALDPVIISKILNRELDPAVLERAMALKVDIFPARWKDLSMHCSCPDWAVPRKHLAAVIYLVSREIDGNPFMVFSLKGVDLTQELKTRHIAIEREAKAALPTVESLLCPPHQSGTSARDAPDQEGYAALDYSILPNLATSLVSVLSANPTFFQHGDFRITYEKVLKRVIRNARLAIGAVGETGNAIPSILPVDKPRIVLNNEYQPVLAGLARLESWPALIRKIFTIRKRYRGLWIRKLDRAIVIAGTFTNGRSLYSAHQAPLQEA